MGLFTPKELGKKVSCMRCGKTYFLTKSAGQTVQSVPAKSAEKQPALPADATTGAAPAETSALTRKSLSTNNRNNRNRLLTELQ